MIYPLTKKSLAEPLRPVTQRLITAMEAAGGRAFIVGGGVRDALMGAQAKDLDIEVYGLEAPKLEKALGKVVPFDVVGKSFGVYKVKNLPIDVSLPRRESKNGTGHRGFEVQGDPSMTFEEACARRDFTINSMLWNLETGAIIDPFKGREDLERKILRHTSAHFSEDPLRVLRAMQFVARFELGVAPETVALCAKILPEDLPPERLFEEWKKLIIKGVRPSLGLRFLQNCNWLRYYPELQALVGCPQDPDWHPEGDVWDHTLHCLDGFASLRRCDEREDLIVGLAVLLHDVGKPAVTKFIDGHYRSRGHDTASVKPAEDFLRRLTNEVALFEAILPLVECHMRPRELYETQATDAAVRRLARKVGRIDRLVRVAQADMYGRPPLSADFPEGAWLLEQARRLEVEDSIPKPIIQGRHLVALGYQPSPAFRGVLDACYEAQLDGIFTNAEGGKAFLNEYLAKNPLRA